MDVTFHCDQDHNFPRPTQLIRGFTYEDYSIEPHTHEFYEMNIILRGSGTHCIQTRRLSVQPGDVFVIPPMVVHAYCDTQALEVYHILLHRDAVAQNRAEAVKVKGYLHLMEIEPFLRSNDSSLFLHLSARQLLQLRSELEFLDDGSPFAQELKNHAAWKVLYWLSWLLARQMEQETHHSKYEPSILKALEYIHANYDEKLTVDALSKLVYLSRSTFLRSFTAICGCSPAAYVRDYRTKKALQLLTQAELSKSEIAHQCGFYDLSHMEKCIRHKKEDA